MKIGYPGLNLSLGCTCASKFKLAAWSEAKFRQTLEKNLDCFRRILEFNRDHGLYFFRIVSDLVPFASHPVNDINWQALYRDDFAAIGAFIRAHRMRISMHPGQYTVINSPNQATLNSALAELVYHAEVFDLLGLDRTNKVQIHVGGIYGEKPVSLARFVERYRMLPQAVRTYLVIENDDRLYNVQDCYAIHEQTWIPIVFDNLHHELLNDGESVADGLALAARTWTVEDGPPMIDYSLQMPGARAGNHADTLDPAAFADFLQQADGQDMDIMFEIKDKETSALKAQRVLMDRHAGQSTSQAG